MPGHLRITLVLALSIAASTSGLTHHQAAGPTSGLAIPGLTHGRMQVVAAHRAEVIALADDQFRTDPTFRRLRNFIALQHAFCLWGLMPGSVADEASPFNECTHADLAAVQALLLHMLGMPAAQEAAATILDRIATGEQAQHGPVICRFGEEPFNTADVMGPRWRDVPNHLPTMLAFLAVVLLTVSAAAWICRLQLRSPPNLSRCSAGESLGEHTVVQTASQLRVDRSTTLDDKPAGAQEALPSET